MENTGYSRKSNPILFGLMYDYHIHICLVWACAIILAMALSIKKGSASYQLGVYGVVLLAAGYGPMSMGLVAITGFEGRFLYLYPMACVTLNDACAFFVGITFGKTPLISLSPNKTVEGFVGGMICNVVGTFLWVSQLEFENSFMYCAPTKYTLNFYENWQCDELDPMYIQEELIFPISIFGWNSILIKRVTIYSCMFAFAASIICPFAGFMASGFKRAYHAKDFGTLLPGHGGFADRFDCMSFMCLFSYIMVT